MAPTEKNNSNKASAVKPPCPMQSLAEERLNPAFPVGEMTDFINGGRDITELKRTMFLEMERDPNWKIDDYPNLSLSEIRERTMKKVSGVADRLLTESRSKFMMRMSMMSIVDPGFWTRFGVHFGLFLGALTGQATPSQFNYWVQKGALSLRGMVGCFGMTELGHGSNVAGLETTATFDESHDQFVINTPTLTATKWWIGGAAQTATHCSVYARLIIKGVDYGVKVFIVQLRDPKTFNLMQGVNIGDIGKKMGRDQIDNGWIQFTNVRIPRSYMLMKHTKVSSTGKVTEPPMAQLAYGALIMGRVSMVSDSANVSRRALTIAIRYAAVRRQFTSGPAGSLETKLLDYTTHQHRLLPLLAQSFAIGFAARKLNQQYELLMTGLEGSKPGSDIKLILEDLKETHATSAGLKAFCTWDCLNIIDQCRQSLGGHGYSAYTGLSTSYQDFAVHCTWEGDNTILMLQCGRFLVTSAEKFKKNLPTPANLSYLGKAGSGEKFNSCTSTNPDEICSIETLKEAWACVAAYSILKAHKLYKESVSTGSTMDQAYEATSAARLHAAKMHITAYLFHCLSDAIYTNECTPGIVEPLKSLALLYGTSSIIKNSGEFLQCKYFDSKQINTLNKKLDELCSTVRKYAVLLVDSFAYPDYVINSPLGKYDGNVYETYFNLVNRLNPNKPVPYFETLIKPMLNRSLETDEGPELEIDTE
ncbi:Acyl-coenzyme A oxidase 2 [Smittium culicis]|uniref:Acyl-coenzyme A oxidase n=1 Tax=Smittium culicis TaxID=133412 RepID=A0A1R1YU12_9FUNG|nr:Acyl-coenzyme A oxidase 2 [Smittium culicis]